MRCPFCKHDDTKVTDSRATDDGRAIRRRRECQACNRRFTTYEMVEEVPLYVIKKDGSRQLFDRNKILNGLLRACNKRRVTRQQLDDIVLKVERNIRNTLNFAILMLLRIFALLPFIDSSAIWTVLWKNSSRLWETRRTKFSLYGRC